MRSLRQPPSLRLFRPLEPQCRPRALQPALRPSGVGLDINIELGHCNSFGLCSLFGLDLGLDLGRPTSSASTIHLSLELCGRLGVPIAPTLPSPSASISTSSSAPGPRRVSPVHLSLELCACLGDSHHFDSSVLCGRDIGLEFNNRLSDRPRPLISALELCTRFGSLHLLDSSYVHLVHSFVLLSLDVGLELCNRPSDRLVSASTSTSSSATAIASAFASSSGSTSGSTSAALCHLPRPFISA